MTIPRRRRAPVPMPLRWPARARDRRPNAADARPELAPQPTERLRAGAPARDRQIGLSEEGVDGLGKVRGLLTRWAQPSTGPPRTCNPFTCDPIDSTPNSSARRDCAARIRSGRGAGAVLSLTTPTCGWSPSVRASVTRTSPNSCVCELEVGGLRSRFCWWLDCQHHRLAGSGAHEGSMNLPLAFMNVVVGCRIAGVYQ